jgi:hypothetical protein
VALARQLAHAHSLAWALHFTAVLHGLRGEWGSIQASAAELLAVAAEQGLAFWLPLGTFDQGWALVGQGQYAEGISRMRQGITGLRATGSQLGQSGLLRTLAEAVARLREIEEGLRILDEAFTVARHNGEEYDEVELWRAKGELTLAQSSCPESRVSSRQWGGAGGGEVLSARHRDCPPPERKIVRTAGGDEPEPPVAEPGQEGGSPAAIGGDVWLVRRGVRHRGFAGGQSAA